ncbi:hypothetical protein T484DRAFT_1792441, partial [Baffinella frigidus]
VPEVAAALGASTERDVCVALVHAAVRMGGRAFEKGREGDALVFFGAALSVAARPPVAPLAPLLRAWVYDSLAGVHLASGDAGAALSFLDSVVEEACMGKPLEAAKTVALETAASQREADAAEG